MRQSSDALLALSYRPDDDDDDDGERDDILYSNADSILIF